jgi:hypothetical protein
MTATFTPRGAGAVGVPAGLGGGLRARPPPPPSGFGPPEAVPGVKKLNTEKENEYSLYELVAPLALGLQVTLSGVRIARAGALVGSVRRAV